MQTYASFNSENVMQSIQEKLKYGYGMKKYLQQSFSSINKHIFEACSISATMGDLE